MKSNERNLTLENLLSLINLMSFQSSENLKQIPCQSIPSSFVIYSSVEWFGFCFCNTSIPGLFSHSSIRFARNCKWIFTCYCICSAKQNLVESKEHRKLMWKLIAYAIQYIIDVLESVNEWNGSIGDSRQTEKSHNTCWSRCQRLNALYYNWIIINKL